MASQVYECIEAVAQAIIDNKDFLTELDREIGDADHGINMARGFKEVLVQLPDNEEDIGKALKKVAMVLISKVGGASGPLYGTAFMKGAVPLAGKTSLALADGVAALEAAIGGIKMRGKAERGDKTMLDALVPACESLSAYAAAGRPAAEALDAACAAAAEGVEYTKTIPATKGRASYLGERSIGHQDPGATSSTIMLEALRDYLAK